MTTILLTVTLTLAAVWLWERLYDVQRHTSMYADLCPNCRIPSHGERTDAEIDAEAARIHERIVRDYS